MKIKYNLFILLFFSFVSSSIGQLSYGFINALQDSKITVSQTKENNGFSINNIVNGDTKIYNTGYINNLPIYVYFDLPNLYYTSNFRIDWDHKPVSYNMYYSNNCNYSNYNYTYDKIGDISYINYNNSNNTFPPSQCQNWIKIPHTQISEYESKSIAWTCSYLACPNVDNYIISSFLIEILELDVGETDIILHQVQIEGANTTDMMQIISPSILPFNSSENINIISPQIGSNHDIFLGNYNCTQVYNQLDIIPTNEDNEYSEYSVSLGSTDAYKLQYPINVNDNHSLCYKQNQFSSIYFRQATDITVYKLDSIFPTTIQRGSSHEIEINSSYPYVQYIALAKDGECKTDRISKTQIVKTTTFYENHNELNEFYLCYSVDDIIWEQTDIKIKIVLGEIKSISGCENTSDITKTINCPTIGGNVLNINGTNFDIYYSNPRVFIENYESTNVTIHNDTTISCLLPEGMGVDLTVKIKMDNEIEKEELLSYKTPEILGLSNTGDNSCEIDLNFNNTIIKCPNDNVFTINIYGTNFGFQNSKVLVGSQICRDVYHYDHSNITCVLNGGRGTKKSVFLFQYQGEMSEGKNFLSYQECELGYEYINEDCQKCSKGYYKDTNGDSYCIKCPDNKFSDKDGSTECNYCEVGTQVMDSSTRCQECGDRYFKSDQTAIVCSNCLENQYTNQSNSSNCYYCDSGYEVLDNKCEKCISGYFKLKSHDLRCTICEDGKYASQEGTSECTKCPDYSESNAFRNGCKCNENYYNNSLDVCIECNNTDFYGDLIYLCNQTNLHLYNISNNLGYWRPHKYTTTFYKCKVDEHCPIERIINDSVICKEYHTGILCNLCVDNYAKNSDEFCELCDGDTNDIRNLTITYFVLGIIGFVTFVVLILITGRGVLLKFIKFMKENGFVEELEFNSEGTSNYSITDSFYSYSTISTLNVNSTPNLNSTSSIYSRYSRSSSDSDRSQDSIIRVNLRRRKKDTTYEATASEQSINLEEEDKVSFAENIQQKFKILISYLQIMSLLSINLDIQWPDFINNLVSGFAFINLDIFTISKHDLQCSFNTTFYNTIILNLITIPILILLVSLAYYIALLISEKTPKKRIELKDRYIYCLVLFIFLIYPAVGSSILKTFKCLEIEGVWYLSEDLSQQCFDETWINYAILSGVFIVVYILGIPFIFYQIMKSNKDLLFIANTQKDNKDNNDYLELSDELKEKMNDKEIMKRAKKFSYRYGFMFMGYENKFWWFEIVEMMKKIVLLATVIYLEESPTRILIAMLMCFGYLGYISYNKPLKFNDDDYLNVLSAAEMFLMLLCALMIDVKINIQDEYNEYAFTGFMFVLLMGIVVIGNYEILKSLLGGHIKPWTIFKALMLGFYEKLKPFYNILCLPKEYDENKTNLDSDSDEESSEDDDIEFTEEQLSYMKKKTKDLHRLSRINGFMETFV